MEFKRLSSAMTVVGALMLPFSAANAGVIDYTATSLGGNLWRYDYAINNPTPSLGFDEVTIYFDVVNFGALSAQVAPAGWDAIVIQPDTVVASDGFYDVLNLGGLLGAGASFSGFSVTAEWLGAGSPGAQAYDLIDSVNFSVVGSGRTTEVVSQVPEPTSLSLVLLALGAATTLRRSKKQVPV